MACCPIHITLFVTSSVQRSVRFTSHYLSHLVCKDINNFDYCNLIKEETWRNFFELTIFQSRKKNEILHLNDQIRVPRVPLGIAIKKSLFKEPLFFLRSKLKTLEWGILNPDLLINLEINNKRTSCCRKIIPLLQ